MRLLRRNRTDDTVATGTAPDAGEKASGKGRPTPKRQRATPPPPPPTSRKEAYARLREKSKEQRSKARVGMRDGDDRYVLPRDRGPLRRLVRDIVDARRNAGSYFFGFAIVILIVSSSPGVSPAIRVAANYVWLAIIVALCLDSYLLARIIKRAIRTRFPEERGSLRGHSLYGVMRAATFRRMRNPRPQVKIGTRV